jgi:hypothetical protein
MPKAVPPAPAAPIDFESLKFRIDEQTRANVARQLGLTALPEKAVKDIEHAVLQYRAASADRVTPGMSIEAINDILKLRKKISRATAQFTDPKSGVDVITFSALEYYATNCEKAFGALILAAEVQKKQLTKIKNMNMGHAKLRYTCGLLRLVFEEFTSLDYRTGPDASRKLGKFVVAVAEAAGFERELGDFESHPERFYDLMGLGLLADGRSVRPPFQRP